MLDIKSEASRCLQCKKPKCVEGCPIKTNIPEMMDMLIQGRLQTAGKNLFENNPLSIVCGLICHHAAQCEGHCILGHKSKAIAIGTIEHYISDYCLDHLPLAQENKIRQKVAIIGSGPAGITIAVVLATKGYDVTIFESHDKIGGVLRYGIPEFRLPKTILDRIQLQLEALNVHIKPNVLVGPVITVDDLFRDGYESVFIGTGVWNPKKMSIKGETLGLVHFAIDYLKNPDVYRFGDHVTIIGAGNVAMDVARTLKRKGVKKVTVMYRKGMEEIPANALEVSHAELEGVEFSCNMNPDEIDDSGIWYHKTVFDGQWDNVGLRQLHPTDDVIIAVSQAPRSNIVSKSKDIQTDQKGFVKTDLHGITTRQGVFASGDVVTGARTVVEAVKYSKEVANSMDKFMSQKRMKVQKTVC